MIVTPPDRIAMAEARELTRRYNQERKDREFEVGLDRGPSARLHPTFRYDPATGTTGAAPGLRVALPAAPPDGVLTRPLPDLTHRPFPRVAVDPAWFGKLSPTAPVFTFPPGPPPDLSLPAQSDLGLKKTGFERPPLEYPGNATGPTPLPKWWSEDEVDLTTGLRARLAAIPTLKQKLNWLNYLAMGREGTYLAEWLGAEQERLLRAYNSPIQ